MFLSAADRFYREFAQIIPFDPGYKLHEDECFEIQEFPVHEDLISACRQPLSADRIQAGDFANLPIHGIVGYDFSQGQRKLFFQNFDSRRVLVPGRRMAVWPISDSSTFQQLQSPVLLLDANITAIWDNGSLKFKSFHLAKQLFDLSAYFAEATDVQIEQFTAHNRLFCPNRTRFSSLCTSWSRTKIALILRGGVLDSTTGELIREAADIVDYPIRMEDGKIVLPDDKSELKALLQFLDEDIYRGPLSQRRLLSSGKRALD